MWERKNPGEKNRRQRLAEEAIKTAERLDKAKEEGAKLERERLRELEKLKGEKSETRQREEREIYERRWKEFVDSTSIVGSAKGQERELTFVDVPWPVYSAASGIGGKRRRGEERAGVEWMTVSSVGEFLVPPAVMSTLSDDESKKKRKDILREAIRRSVFSSPLWSRPPRANASLTLSPCASQQISPRQVHSVSCARTRGNRARSRQAGS